MSYKLDPTYIYIIARRGDNASDIDDLIGYRDGMVSYIDPQDWFGAPVYLSDFTLKRNFVAKCSRSWKTALKDIIIKGKDSNNRTIPVKAHIDYAGFTQLKTDDGETIQDPCNYIYTPTINPIWDLTNYTPSILKDSTKVDFKKIKKVKDFNTVSSGSYTVGSGPTDDYPTLNGAGGFLADMEASLTAPLTATVTTALTEIETTSLLVYGFGNYPLKITSSINPHDDPTGNRITSSSAGGILTLHLNGSTGQTGSHEIYYLNCKTIVGQDCLVTSAHGAFLGHSCYVHDNILDGNNTGASAINYASNTKMYIWNNICSDWTTGFYITGGPTLENNISLNNGYGFRLGNTVGYLRNNVAVGGNYPYYQIGSATGASNASSDNSAGDANWANSFGNISGLVKEDHFASLDIQNPNFGKLWYNETTLRDGGTLPMISGHTTDFAGNTLAH